MKIRRTPGEKVFQVLDYLLMIFLLATIVLPLMNVLSVSLSNREAVIARQVTIFPIGFQLESYRQILINESLLIALRNTVFITVVGTTLAVLVTTSLAYAMSGEFLGKKIVTAYLIFTMYFGGGLIATYIILTRYLRLNNTYWVFFLPGLVSVFYMIVIRSQIQTIPQEIFDAADVDGASEWLKLFRITVPAIVPTVAAISMFWALGYWNSWSTVMIYAPRKEFWTLQYFLRGVVFSNAVAAQAVEPGIIESKPPPETFQMAAIVVVAAPIVAIYPFVQKYFTKGILAGAVKG